MISPETQLKDFSKNHSADNFEDHIVKKVFHLSEKNIIKGQKSHRYGKCF